MRGVDYTGGHRLHLWAREAGFDVLECDAYHPHYVGGPYKGFWGWTFREGGASLVEEGAMAQSLLDELSAGMQAADDDPATLVAHARMHQVIARKPLAAA